MKTAILALALAAALPTSAHAARYTYHGELLDGEAPAAGRYDLRVQAFAAPGAKSPLGEPTSLAGVAVVDGRFSAELELPENPRGDTWVEVAVRKAGSSDAYETLGTPQAVAKVNSTCPGAWALDGNTGVPAGSFLGLADPNNSMPLELRVENLRAARFSNPGFSTYYGDAPAIALGASVNVAGDAGATVAGGGSTADANGVACPGCRNAATEQFSTVGGGASNTADAAFATIAGGGSNIADAPASTVGGGSDNEATGFGATVPGGTFNTARGQYSVALGFGSCAGGFYSFALGQNGRVRNGAGSTVCGAQTSGDANGDEGTFVWADVQNLPFTSTGPNQFLVRAQGGVGINAAPPVGSVELTVTSDADEADFPNIWLKQKSASNAGVLLSAGNSTGASNNSGFYIDHYTGGAQARRLALNPDGSVQIRSNATEANTGVTMAPNDGAWSSLSDRRLKTAVAAIDPLAILERLVDTPITTWSYVAQGTAVRHIGPMAQDFSAAFGVGANDTTINTVDADGVALAAIQGLNAKLEHENAALRAQLDDVLARLERIETARNGAP